MIQRDDRGGLRQAVTLDDDKSKAAPEGFERSFERRGADHERPEFQSEQAMHGTVPPPSLRDAFVCRRHLAHVRVEPRDVIGEDVENLRHRYEHGNAPRLHLPHDFVRVVAADEHDGAVEHRRHERGHGLSEHVAERQQVQEADGKERFAVRRVFAHLAFHRDDVGEDVAVRQHHTLGLGCCARGEDDFDRVVARHGHGTEGGGIERAEVDVGEFPRRLGRTCLSAGL